MKKLLEKIVDTLKIEKRRNLKVFFMFTFFSVIILYPVSFFLRSRLWGMTGIEDLQESFHLYWWWKRYISYLYTQVHFQHGFCITGLGGFFRDILAYPVLKEMGNNFDFFFNVIFEAFLPFPVWYNVKMILVFILNGYCFYLMCRYFIKDTMISVVMGLIFAVSPYSLLQFAYGRIEQVFLFPLPLFILYLYKCVFDEEKRTVNAVLCGVFLALASLFYWFYGLFACLFLGVFGIYVLIKAIKEKKLFLRLLNIAGALLIFMLLCAPFLYPFYKTALLDEGKVRGMTVLRNVEFPDINKPFFVDEAKNAFMIIIDSCSPEYIFVPTREQYIPFVLTLFAFASLPFIKKIPGLWYAAFLFFYTLSWGPYLHFMERMINPPVRLFPYTLMFQYVPFFTRLSWPSRIVSLVLLFLCLLAGYGLFYLSKVLMNKIKLPKPVLPIVLLLTYIVLTAWMKFLPVQTSKFHIPDIYTSNLQGGIIELPFNARFNQGVPFYRHAKNPPKSLKSWESFMSDLYYYHFEDKHKINYYQVFHQQKRFNDSLKIGNGIRETDIVLTIAPYAAGNSVINYFINLSLDPDSEEEIQKSDVDKLIDMGYRYLIVHKGHFREIANIVISYWGDDSLEIQAQEWNYPPIDRIAPMIYEKYINSMEKTFGSPIITDYEYYWTRTTFDKTAMRGRWIDNYAPAQHEIKVYLLENFKGNSASHADDEDVPYPF